MVSETSYGNQNATAPLAKRPSRFDKEEKVDPASLTAQQLRIKQRQQKVQERIATVELGFIFITLRKHSLVDFGTKMKPSEVK